MSKYSLLFLSVLIVMVMTVFTQQITELSVTNSVDSTSELEFSQSSFRNFTGTYFDLLSFDVEGLPQLVEAIFSLFFVALNLTIGFILLELVVKFLQVLATAIPL